MVICSVSTGFAAGRRLSELDDERQTYLLTRMGEHQTIVTTCDTAAFARTNGKIVMVKGGVVEEA